MRREIKFRIWHLQHIYYVDRMRTITLYDDCSGTFDDDNDDFHFDFRDEDVLMQFTGLKDKNGVEIYEGDIYAVKHNGRLFYIKFSENQLVLVAKEVKSKTNWRSLEDINRISKYIEVIGNIYENPELL